MRNWLILISAIMFFLATVFIAHAGANIVKPSPSNITLKRADLTAKIRFVKSGSKILPIYTVSNKGGASVNNFRVEVYYKLPWGPNKNWQLYGYEDIASLDAGKSRVVSQAVSNPAMGDEGAHRVGYRVIVDAKNTVYEISIANNTAEAYSP